VDIFVRGACGGWAVGCPYAGEAAVQAAAVYDASVLASRADGEPVAAKTARHCDIAASLRNNRLDCDALCPANTTHQAQAKGGQVCILPWFG